MRLRNDAHSSRPWRIHEGEPGDRQAGADFALLGADSWIGMPAELLFRPGGGTLLFTTFVRQRNPLAKAVWSVVGPPHRRIVPRLLDRAVGRHSEEGPL